MSVPHTRRKPLHAPRGVVATSQPLAASAGLAVLRQGGNAVDAAIATAAALAVVQPGSNDIGSDLFALVWDGSRLHGLNASGRSPAALTFEAARAAGVPATGPGAGVAWTEERRERSDRSDEGRRRLEGPGTRARGGGRIDSALGGAQADAALTMPARGWLPVTVPGAPAGWRDLHARFGRLPFPALLADAAHYAEHGFPVSPSVAYYWGRGLAAIRSTLDGRPEHAEWLRVFAPGGRAPVAGELFRNPDAARTLRLIGETGAESFYRGDTASALVGFAGGTGGLLSGDDLAAHESTWVDPISVRYRDHEVWEIPPNGQGIAALQALGILAGFDRPVGVHEQIEAMKLGFADAHAYVADPAAMRVQANDLLDADYLARRRGLITDKAATPAPGDPARGGTVYLCTADAGGMMVSLIQSNYMGFGSYVVAPGTGFTLQNRGAGFALDAEHPNAAAPSKRPFHTIIPGFLTRGGDAVGPFGVMGGHMQPQGHLQVVLSTVDDGLDPQAALDRPRWYWHAGRAVQVEDGFPDVESLRARGHEVTVVPEPAGFGYGQAIWRAASGGLVAGTEPRADGVAVGY